MKRIVTVQDISCVGKCSLTVALPVISAMGVEAAILPTAVLSTHTMFSGFTVRDLTDEIEPIAAHWEKEGFAFDALYTGYLGSFEQIDLMKNFFDRFGGNGAVKFVDPAMGDGGKLYPAFDEAFAKKMGELCAKADITVPNITEACFMTGTPYLEKYDRAYVEDLLKKLTGMGAKIALLTGVGFKEGETGVMGYEQATGEFFYYSHAKHPISYHGTGDIFSSTCIGAMMRGFDWKKAAAIAADYTAKCIELTIEDKKGPWYGVNFEQAIPMLVAAINQPSSDC